MEQGSLKNVDDCLNTNIYTYLETSGSQSSNLYLNVHFFKTSVNQTSVAAKDSYFPAFVSNILIEEYVLDTNARKELS